MKVYTLYEYDYDSSKLHTVVGSKEEAEQYRRDWVAKDPHINKEVNMEITEWEIPDNQKT